MKKTLFILSILALGFTACNKEIEAPTVYQVCIPASMEADTKAVSFEGTTSTSTFLTTEKVYVYNQADEGAMLGGYLQPTNVSADGKTCDLTGSLTGTIAADDNLVLLYNLSHYDSDKDYCYFEYDTQKGTQAGVTDGAIAMVTVASYAGSGELITTTKAHFQNVQSMFRFQFASGGMPVSVKSVLITSNKTALSTAYYPLNAKYPYLSSFSIPVSLPSATTDPIYVALCMDESKSDGDELTFGVVDADNKYYTKTKAAPSGGFKNGRYYYNSAPIGLDYVAQLVKPTLSRSDDGKDSELADASPDRCFYIYSPSLSSAGEAKGITMDMSGTSTEYRFYLVSDASNTMNISGLTATYDGVDEDDDFIYSTEALSLRISGENTIVCRNSRFCVDSYNVLKLSGYGTLTVTSNDADGYGIAGSNYNPHESADHNALAADGYTVTISSRTDNPDGTYTWTYTVKPAGALSGKFTVNGSGKQVLFSQGNLKRVNGTWSFHTNQYDYLGTWTSTNCDLFYWETTGDYGSGFSCVTRGGTASDVVDWGSNIGSGWRTLTKDEWTYLFNTRTTSSGLRFAKAKVNNVNGVILLPDNWSTTYYSLSADIGYNSNVISSSDWTSSLEAHGAVFLPAAGTRSEYTVDTSNAQGYYWSSTPDATEAINAHNVYFTGNSLTPAFSQFRQTGRSVRLVRDVE